MVKPPKIQEERKRERVEEEEVVDYVVLPEDAKYATDVLEVLDDTETSSEV